MKDNTRYKFLRLVDNEIKSSSGNLVWKIGEWQKIKGKVQTCENGLHCSVRVFDALSYVPGGVIAKVEVLGKSDISKDKEAWSEMRIVTAWAWTKKDSVALSIYAAELVLENYEKLVPGDTRPRDAIEAAKKWLKKPTKRNESAAESAARSARSAARSAESAAWSAESAAWSARSARSAAESAARSAESAASEKILDQINEWMIARIEELEELS